MNSPSKEIARALSVAAAVAAVAAAVGSEVACRGIPQATCTPDKLDVDLLEPQRAACNACMEDNCCDAVGECQDDPTCADTVAGAHGCVVDAGILASKNEKGCTEGIVAAGGRPLAAYTCMRNQCGEACGLPVCSVVPAAPQFFTPDCDTCVTGACCDAINACYGNRTCKLILECMITNCATELAESIGVAANGGPVPGLDEAAAQECASPGTSDGGPLPPVGPFACFYEHCIGHYDEQGPVLDPTKSAGCLSTQLFTCGARAPCAAECKPAPPAADAGADADASGG